MAGRHSSPRRTAAKQRRMQGWERRQAQNIRAGRERARRSASQRFEWPLSGQRAAGAEHPDCDEAED
jgi:hypothetical protein